MRFEESFTVDYQAADVWAFFEDVHRLARCVPGVEAVEPLEDGRSRLVMTQRVGYLSATFDMRMHVAAQEPGRYVEVVSVGRSVKGAVGELRSRNRVEIEPADESKTTVKMAADVALGGMLGSVGTKVMQIKAKQVAKEFAATLSEQIHLFRAQQRAQAQG
jgi:carbon monoxide dehydrogenase subunit G